ncbi:MAG: hypothetical protein RLZZ245_831 [Verrucomicrobiota bacterium]
MYCQDQNLQPILLISVFWISDPAMPRKNPVRPEIHVAEANNRPEQPMNNTQNTDWSSMPPNAIWLLAVTIFMSFVGFLLGGLRERINRKRKAVDQFRSIIARQLADLDTHRWSEAAFYTQSVPIITDATYAFRPFISHRCRRALDHILADYQARHESVCTRSSESYCGDEEADWRGWKSPLCTFEGLPELFR